MKRPIVERLRPMKRDSGFRMEGYFIWCSTLVRAEGAYHLFASRWPEGTGDSGDPIRALNGYREHSEIVRAVADRPLGPYRFEEVALAGRGEGHWDGQGCHSAKIVRVGERFVLFYQAIAKGGRLRKIGVAWADSVRGPWRRPDAELPLTEDANNPAPYVRPDRSILLIWRDEQLRLYAAEADRYDGEVRVIGENIFPESRIEDPDIFHCDGRLNMVAEDNQGLLTGTVRHGAHLVSDDGLRWRPHEHPEVYTHDLVREDGGVTRVARRERPELFNDREGVKGRGEPTHLLTGVFVDGHAWCAIQEIAPE